MITQLRLALPLPVLLGGAATVREALLLAGDEFQQRRAPVLGLASAPTTIQAIEFAPDSVLEEDGFELVVPPRTKRLSEGPGVAIWVSDMTSTGAGFQIVAWWDGEFESPLLQQ
jgi:hypothetical protein